MWSILAVLMEYFENKKDKRIREIIIDLRELKDNDDRSFKYYTYEELQSMSNREIKDLNRRIKQYLMSLY